MDIYSATIMLRITPAYRKKSVIKSDERLDTNEAWDSPLISLPDNPIDCTCLNCPNHC